MRQRLEPYYQETHIFTARFQKYSKTIHGSNVVCLVGLCLGGQAVADHIWIHRSKQVKQLELKNGDMVEFEARVCKYARDWFAVEIEDISLDYGLEKIREFRVTKREGD